jgi:DNA mismatch repair ATPase MutS
VVLGVLPPGLLVGVFFTGLLITLPYAKKIGHLSGMTGKMQEVFRQYGRLVSLVEGNSFKAGKLEELKASLSRKEVPVSEILRSLNSRISALDQRNNLLVAVFGNAFFLWDLRQAYALEDWMANHGAQAPNWFGALSGFDALNSLGNFAFNHPRYVFPDIQEKGETALKVEQLAHPLLFGPVVRNDVRIESGHFLVITGANMAGKSTFLRAVSLCLVMANSGLPVCGESMVYSPIPLITSMRATDSLSRHESYFFAELQRLKRIVDHLGSGPYFVVLDEILKGTNSMDKAKGSREFLERLLKMPATGLIATHDLSLCEVAVEQPQVQNCFFDVEIRNGELYFDYRLKAGVCSNMNASFLLRKLGVVEGNVRDSPL